MINYSWVEWGYSRGKVTIVVADWEGLGVGRSTIRVLAFNRLIPFSTPVYYITNIKLSITTS